MSAFDQFCEAKRLDDDQANAFANYCYQRTQRQPYMLAECEVERLFDSKGWAELSAKSRAALVSRGWRHPDGSPRD